MKAGSRLGFPGSALEVASLDAFQGLPVLLLCIISLPSWGFSDPVLCFWCFSRINLVGNRQMDSVAPSVVQGLICHCRPPAELQCL